MILKKDLLRGLDLLTEQLFVQGETIEELETRIKKLEKLNAQPRDKSGKFAKKK